MTNVFCAVGRFTHDPELKYTTTGKAVCNFQLAVNRKFVREGEEQADFFRCTAWNKLAENVANYCYKGMLVSCEGRIELSKYEKDGIKQTGINYVLNDVTFLSSKADKEKEKAGDFSQPAPEEEPEPEPEPAQANIPEEPVYDDDDLPF